MTPYLSTVVLIGFCLYACRSDSDKTKVKEVVIIEHETPEERELMNFWKDFSRKFNSLDTISVKKITLDTIWLWGERVSCDDFIKRYWQGYKNTDFSNFILDSNKTRSSSIGCHPSPPVEEAEKFDGRGSYTCHQIFVEDTLGKEVTALEFSFLKTTIGYKLFGISNYTYVWSKTNRIADTIEPGR